MAHSLGLRTQMVGLCLVLTYTWQKDVVKILKVPGARRDVNPARAITWLV